MKEKEKVRDNTILKRNCEKESKRAKGRERELRRCVLDCTVKMVKRERENNYKERVRDNTNLKRKREKYRERE